MKVLDFLKTHKAVFMQSVQLNVSAADLNHIGMIEEYNDMVKNGHKEPNVRALMCRRYNLTRGKFEGIRERINREYDIDSI